jgi:hypothetical protein
LEGERAEKSGAARRVEAGERGRDGAEEQRKKRVERSVDEELGEEIRRNAVAAAALMRKRSRKTEKIQ